MDIRVSHIEAVAVEERPSTNRTVVATLPLQRIPDSVEILIP
jgi:hypothetical protein